jgi:plastocyanin
MKRAITACAAIAVAAGVTALPSSGASTSKTVAVKDSFFGPKTLKIANGAKVVWVWKGKERHNVAVASGPSTFRAGTRKTGKFRHTFKKAGTYQIVCTIHAPDMHMKIVVK